jgi:hypothetical protein
MIRLWMWIHGFNRDRSDIVRLLIPVARTPNRLPLSMRTMGADSLFINMNIQPIFDKVPRNHDARSDNPMFLWELALDLQIRR